MAAENTPYRVLARKYRPQDFTALVGQEALVRTLSNAFESSRIPHAILLTGIRGIGKTTTARIIARALNCTGTEASPIVAPTPMPCGVCPNCVAIGEDRHPDVLEMDAASRTGVGDIRELIETVRYLPTSARYKVYIIDEVHMLSTSAFNALLKTLEEPPPHVKFIFATTEIRKIPVTILSRCMRFDLKRLDSARMGEHLGNIATKEQVGIENGALRLIAAAAEGSVRDGLSLLDQAIAHAGQETGSITITEHTVQNMLGLADASVRYDLLEAALDGNAPSAIAILERLYQAGADPVLTLQDLLEATHLLTRCRLMPDALEHQALPQAQAEKAKALSAKLDVPALGRAWQMLLKGVQEAKTAPDPLTAAEMVLIRLAYLSNLPSPEELVKAAKSTPAPSAPPARPTPTPGGMAYASGGLASQPAPATEPIAMAAPQNFNDVVALFEERREGLIVHWLRSETKPIDVSPGKLSLAASTRVPAEASTTIAARLLAWTGMRWSVSLSTESWETAGEDTLSAQAEKAAASRLATAAAHPLVAEVLAAFPGARIVDVKPS
ncbi:MAG: DNA polymerase III subunit gamma/tau [Alphaproteobacteria bacterium]|nr:DNA polymerase III subunit gamma/tau [Alphaproteobacteria bacterium]